MDNDEARAELKRFLQSCVNIKYALNSDLDLTAAMRNERLAKIKRNEELFNHCIAALDILDKKNAS